MDAADNAIVFFSHHALQLKGLPALESAQVYRYFQRTDLEVFDDKETLQQRVRALLDAAGEDTCLLLMSSGTFDGIQWIF